VQTHDVGFGFVLRIITKRIHIDVCVYIFFNGFTVFALFKRNVQTLEVPVSIYKYLLDVQSRTRKTKLFNVLVEKQKKHNVLIVCKFI